MNYRISHHEIIRSLLENRGVSRGWTQEIKTTFDTRIFSPRVIAGLCVDRSLLVSIQAFNSGLSRSILPIRTHSDI